ncbi:oxidoreductase [Pseudoduganella sp. FT55W]|uniref:Oxidoreductase n=1 Tax=Duganella rivi TaxID=2666083 RepID=A0A7X4GVW6_9BURK|nr:phage tail protein [Duganella rivi]MYM70503.1 oxidoreductase [Duganella rivi]
MLMSLDQFVFGLDTLAYDALQRQTRWKHRNTSRVGARDAFQFLGPGDETISLTGVVTPEMTATGDLSALQDLRDMADEGEAYVLVDGAGYVYGAFVVEMMGENQTYHDQDGIPRKVEFTIGLTRVPDTQLSEQEQGEAEE